LAVGVPVVMNAFASLPEFDGLVSVAMHKDDFVNKLKWEVENDSASKIKRREDFASNNSWEARTETFAGFIEQVIAILQIK
jgi:hypothetical protein